MILGKLLVQAPTWIVDGIDSLPSVCYLCLLLIFSYRNNLHSCSTICSVPVLLAFFLINQSLPIPISWWIFPIVSRFLCGFSFFKKNYLIHFEWIFEEIRDKNPIKFLCWIVYQHQLLKRPHFCTVSFCILCQILCMLSFLVSFLGPLPYSCILICFLCVYQTVYMTIAIRCNNKNNTHVVNFSILSVSDHSFPEGK